MKLDENDRSTTTRLMKVKDMLLKEAIEEKRAAEHRGQGYGKALLQYGMERYGVKSLTVNEQNPQAVGFYEYMGFSAYKRTDLDEEGNPYPLLYMKL